MSEDAKVDIGSWLRGGAVENEYGVVLYPGVFATEEERDSLGWPPDISSDEHEKRYELASKAAAEQFRDVLDNHGPSALREVIKELEARRDRYREKSNKSADWMNATAAAAVSAAKHAEEVGEDTPCGQTFSDEDTYPMETEDVEDVEAVWQRTGDDLEVHLPEERETVLSVTSDTEWGAVCRVAESLNERYASRNIKPHKTYLVLHLRYTVAQNVLHQWLTFGDVNVAGIAKETARKLPDPYLLRFTTPTEKEKLERYRKIYRTHERLRAEHPDWKEKKIERKTAEEYDISTRTVRQIKKRRRQFRKE